MKKSYEGSCHYRNVRFTAEMEITEVMSCNCSICSRKGHLLAFTSEEKFNLKQGENFLSDYQFGEKKHSPTVL